MKFSSLFLMGLLLSQSAHADSTDVYLRDRLKFFGVDPYETLPEDHSEEHESKVNLGRRLFIDTNLSGNKRVSCMTCHNPMKGTSDGKPLSQTEDGKGVLRRNSIGLYNVGDPSNSFMFWDGRVQYLKSKQTFITPEPDLNGANPKRNEITQVMTSALAAQAIFPLVNHDEMSGRAGENEIASAKTNAEAWDLLVKRVSSPDYMDQFKRAYPNIQKVNIGHVGEAMATFMREQFQSNTSPFHRYIAGDNSAMTEQQKRGLLVFIERGNCIACHQGNLLGNNAFFASVGVPMYGAKPFSPDRGRGEVGENFRNFFFKTPSLINVGLTAPYMHNGAFKTIREVLNHYNNVKGSMSNYEAHHEDFSVAVEVLKSNADQTALWNSIQAGFLRRGLGLSSDELDDLEEFLKVGLTDPKWNPEQIPLKKRNAYSILGL